MICIERNIDLHILIISVFQGWGRWHVYNIGSINLVFDPIYTLNYKINKIPSLRSQKNVEESSTLFTVAIYDVHFWKIFYTELFTSSKVNI